MGSVHARVLASVPGVDVAAVVDSRREVAFAIGEEIGAPSFESVARAATEADLEAVLVATPTPTHPALVGQALHAGLHVLCEKPLSLDRSVDGELGSLASGGGLVLQIGFWRRFSSPWAHAKRLIAAGAIGRPLMVRLAQWDADPPPAEFCDPAVSGGLAVDCGVHEYDLAEWLTGLKVRSVVARNLPLAEPSLADVGDVDNLVALLELEGGVTATVDLSRNARYADDVRTEVLGSEGAIFVDLLPVGRTRLADASGFSEVSGSVVEDATLAGVAGQAAAFARAVRGESVAFPGAAASSRALLIGRKVQEAAASGRSVAVAD